MVRDRLRRRPEPASGVEGAEQLSHGGHAGLGDEDAAAASAAPASATARAPTSGSAAPSGSAAAATTRVGADEHLTVQLDAGGESAGRDGGRDAVDDRLGSGRHP